MSVVTYRQQLCYYLNILRIAGGFGLTPTTAKKTLFALIFHIRSILLHFDVRIRYFCLVLNSCRMKKGLPTRLVEARKNKELSQQELAALAKVHYTNIGRYERGEANPSPDFLMNGTLHDKSTEAIEDEELLIQFRKIERLPSDKKKIVKELIDAFIFKADLQKQLA